MCCKSKTVTQKITKFGVNMYPTSFSTPFDYEWPWPSSTRSFGLKILEIWRFGGLTCMVNHGVIFSSMAFKLGANRVHIGMFNISSGFFEIQKFKILPEFWRFSHFDSDSRDFHTDGGVLIRNMRMRTAGDLPGELGQWVAPIFIAWSWLAGSLYDDNADQCIY